MRGRRRGGTEEEWRGDGGVDDGGRGRWRERKVEGKVGRMLRILTETPTGLLRCILVILAINFRYSK